MEEFESDDECWRFSTTVVRCRKVFQAEEGTAQADERDVLMTLVEAYENKHYDFGPVDPMEAIKFRMEQGGLTPRDLEPFIGPSGRVSEVLNRKRPLSLRMVKRPHDGLKIPYESLLTEGPDCAATDVRQSMLEGDSYPHSARP